MSKIEVDAIDKQSGSTLTLGGSGTAVTLACGATQSGFGRTGTVDWQTGSIKTSDFTAVNTQGFFVDTNSGVVTATLPAGSAGAIISFQDYRNTFDTNALTVSPNGSDKINGGNGPVILNTEGEGITLVYIDSTVGWRSIQDNVFSDVGSEFISATGGTITTSGDYKIHTFTGPGTFDVTATGIPANNAVDYVVVAGGGGGGAGCGAGGGGGAGGFRFFATTPLNPQSGPAAPRNGYGSPTPSGTAITITATSFPITVGSGGTLGSAAGPPGCGGNGNPSTFSTVTSTGGGGAAAGNSGSPVTGNPGGSGGGAARNRGASGSGNTPPVTPPQGSDAGDGSNAFAGDGGGGAMAAGGATACTPGASSGLGGAGGAGAGITGFGTSGQSCGGQYYFSGGGGGGTFVCASCTQRPGTNAHGGVGGGGPGSLAPNHPGSPNLQEGIAGTANTGGGGGGGGESPAVPSPTNDGSGGAGGSGIVIIRYKFQ